MKETMKKVFRKIFKQDVYDSIPYDELMLKQRFVLFRIFAFTGFLVSLLMATQYYFIDPAALLPPFLVVLALVIILSFYLTKDYKKLPVSYAVALSAAFLLMHFQAYNTGGVKNTGTMYFCVLILCAFMLLGPKAGKWFTAYAIASVAFLFYANEYGDMTSYSLFHNNIHEINQDAVTTFILALFL